MKAVILNGITKAEDVTISECPIPEVKSGWVLVRIMGFGLNHSEQILRLSEIEQNYIQKPIVPGIECVGIIENPSDSAFVKGDKVVALMGGMGRSYNGSYAEYALLPSHHVFKVRSDLSWEEMAAIPETYFTSWGSLFECLHLKKDDTLLIRGATCALGYASIQIAKALGAKVIATTHKKEKLPLLKEADEAIIDDGNLASRGIKFNKALDLVGPRFLKDTLRAIAKGGIVCNTGILGGVYALNGFDPIKDIPNGVYLTGFFSNYPTKETIDAIFVFMNEHNFKPVIGKSFKFSEIREACIALDQGKVNGKIVVMMA